MLCTTNPHGALWGEHIRLYLFLLGDRLHDEVAVGEVAETGGIGQAIRRGRGVLGGEFSVVHRAVQRAAHPGAGRVECARVDLGDQYVQTRPGTHLGDPGVHQAVADNPHLLEVVHKAGISRLSDYWAYKLLRSRSHLPCRDFATWYSGPSEIEKDAEAAKGEQAMRELADDEVTTEPPTAPPPERPTPRRRRGDDYVEDFSDRNWIDE